MNVDVIDREVQFPYRVKLTPVSGTTDEFDISLIPGNITAQGTEINRAFHNSFKNAIFSLVNYLTPNSEFIDNDTALLTVDAFMDSYQQNRILHLNCITPEKTFDTRIARTVEAKYCNSTTDYEGANADLTYFNTDVNSTSSSSGTHLVFNSTVKWVKFKLDVPILAKNFIIRSYSGSTTSYKNYRSANHTIYGSNDGVNWQQLFTESGNKGDVGEYEIDLSDNTQYYQYYKFEMTDASQTIWFYGIRISDYVMHVDTIDNPQIKVNNLETKTISGTLNNRYLYDLIYDGTVWKPYLSATDVEKRLTDLENAVVTLSGT